MYIRRNKQRTDS